MHGPLDPKIQARVAARSGAATPPALRVQDLTVAYEGDPVVFDVSFEVQPGTLMGIIGPNGAGKSTLLRAALGILPNLAGQVQFFGTSPQAARKRVAYVPQRTSVDWDFPTTVYDLVLMGTYGSLGWFRRPGKKERARTEAALEMVEMREFADRQIRELSGGQQQRIFLARALVQNADLYLMDEPFAGVDAKTEQALVRLMQELSAQNKALLVVHHDLATVRSYFDEVLLLNRRRIACGPVQDVFVPAHIDAAYGGTVRTPQLEAR